jgi:hypothetical protein
MSEIKKEFVGFPKIHRFYRDVVITEKIDGTNGAIVITDDGHIYAQSRKRIITPADDNFGFAAWVHVHKDVLVEFLGPGRHFGEWWGKGIQRGYGVERRYFSLFDARRWEGKLEWSSVAEIDKELNKAEVAGLRRTPILYEGDSISFGMLDSIEMLADLGSTASPGFKNPEGVVVHHIAANVSFKYTFGNDVHKGGGN